MVYLFQAHKDEDKIKLTFIFTLNKTSAVLQHYKAGTYQVEFVFKALSIPKPKYWFLVNVLPEILTGMHSCSRNSDVAPD